MYAPFDNKSALVRVMLRRLNRYQTIIWTDIHQMVFVTEGQLGPNKLIVSLPILYPGTLFCC